jgi:ketosteroid isomerase-like protein
MNSRSKLSLVLFLCIIISTQVFAGDDLDKLKTTIKEINDKLIEASIKGDIETMISCYTDDVIYMQNYGEMLKGKAAIKKSEEESKNAGLKIHSMTFTTLEVWACGDLVYEIGTYELSLTLPGMDQPVPDNGKYLTVWQKQDDDSLKIKIEIWNTNMNPWTM